MNGTEWLDSLPENPGIERDNKVLEAVKTKLIHCEWYGVTSTYKNHHATFYVCDDALHVDLEDGSRYRPMASATLVQKCADLIPGTMLPTAKIMDLSYLQADVVLDATVLPAGPDMDTATRSKFYNVNFEKKRAKKTGLIRDCGKAWILHNNLGNKIDLAINYGFYDKKAIYKNPQGIKVWQNIGTRHNRYHEDYSQVLILMLDQCELNGNLVNISDLAKDPELSYLLNYEGKLKYLRQPGI